MIQLIVFRAIQGIGGGGILTLGMIISASYSSSIYICAPHRADTLQVSDVVSLKERGKYQGLIGGVVALSNSLGPILGGIFTEKASWRWVFLLSPSESCFAHVRCSAPCCKARRARLLPRWSTVISPSFPSFMHWPAGFISMSLLFSSQRMVYRLCSIVATCAHVAGGVSISISHLPVSPSSSSSSSSRSSESRDPSPPNFANSTGTAPYSPSHGPSSSS